MEEIKGATLESVWGSLSDVDQIKVVGDILDIISLHKLQSPNIGDSGVVLTLERIG